MQNIMLETTTSGAGEDVYFSTEVDEGAGIL